MNRHAQWLKGDRGTRVATAYTDTEQTFNNIESMMSPWAEKAPDMRAHLSGHRSKREQHPVAAWALGLSIMGNNSGFGLPLNNSFLLGPHTTSTRNEAHPSNGTPFVQFAANGLSQIKSNDRCRQSYDPSAESNWNGTTSGPTKPVLTLSWVVDLPWRHSGSMSQ